MGSYVISMRAETTRKPFARHNVAIIQYFFFILASCIMVLALPSTGRAQVTIAQISDTHLGEPHAPHAFDNLRRTVDMVNARHPDAVIVSGDVGENYDQWLLARGILKWLHAPVYYAPGNHDVHTTDVEKYREVFGPDYYRFQVKGVTFLVIDSQLLGNFDNFDAQSPEPMPPQTEAESQKMLSWLSRQASGRNADNGNRRHWWKFGRQQNQDSQDPMIAGTTMAMRMTAAEKLLSVSSTSPRLVVTICLRILSLTGSSTSRIARRELNLLHRIGVRHMLVGHWHVGNIFERDGITWHVAPTTSRLLPWSTPLGFAMHTISPNGDVKTEFVSINSEP